MRDILERRQIWIYFAAVLAGAVAQDFARPTWIEPALAFMLFVTFLQVPLSQIGNGFRQVRFLFALLIANFVAIPVLVFA
ncbi:hypothetical protein, partial [Pseudoalteromonas sp. SYSU M81241]